MTEDAGTAAIVHRREVTISKKDALSPIYVIPIRIGTSTVFRCSSLEETPELIHEPHYVNHIQGDYKA